MKHTKGTWYAGESVNIHEQRMIASEEKGQTIAICYGLPEVEANAHLIAAAPELLEACYHVIENLQQESPEVWEHEIAALQYAINKAEEGA